jgi:hypothetical protein
MNAPVIKEIAATRRFVCMKIPPALSAILYHDSNRLSLERLELAQPFSAASSGESPLQLLS